MIKVHAKTVVITTVIVFILIVLGAFGALGFIGQPASSGLSPVLGWFYAGASNVGAAWQRLTAQDELTARLLELEQRQTELNSLLIEVEELRVENSQLKQLVEYRADHTIELLSARVVGRELLGSRELMLIDKGIGDGLVEGNLVLDEQGQLLGDIVSTQQSLSFVRGLTDPDFTLAASLADESAVGRLQGDLSIGLQLEQVPLEAELKPGDLIVTAGALKAPVGKIELLETATGDLFKSAKLVPLTVPSNVLFVSVVSGGQQ